MNAAALSLCAALVLVASAARAIDVEVTDGDSFRLDGQTIRLWGIEAPELNQECRRNGRPWYPGPDAAAALKQALSKLTEMSCSTRDIDRQGRSVATCQGNGEDVGTVLVRGGWAFDFFEYSGGFYVPAEAKARTEQRGLWAGECQEPWRWRQQHREPGSRPASKAKRGS